VTVSFTTILKRLRSLAPADTLQYGEIPDWHKMEDSFEEVEVPGTIRYLTW